MAPVTTQEPISSFQTTIAQLADRVEHLLKRQTQDAQDETNNRQKGDAERNSQQGIAKKTKQQKRALIGLAGVPGSGKSTVSAALMFELSKRGVGIGGEVVVVPMDGFHHTKASLSAFADPVTAFKRRGAPFTFDADAFVELVLKLKEFPVTSSNNSSSSFTNTDSPSTSSSSPLSSSSSPSSTDGTDEKIRQNETELFMYAPSFDHAVQDPVPDAIPISSQSRVVIVEGNYTLLDVQPWAKLRGVWDQKWFVDADPELVKARLVARHLAAGIETDVQKAAKRVEENDLVNGEAVRDALGEVDVVIMN